MPALAHPLKTRARILEIFAQTGQITKACHSVGVSHMAHYRWLKSDPEYAAAFEVARQQAIAGLESECMRRAWEGTKRPVYQMGTKVGEITEYSDSLATWLLRGHCPERYNEKHQHEYSGQVDVNHTVKFVEPAKQNVIDE